MICLNSQYFVALMNLGLRSVNNMVKGIDCLGGIEGWSLGETNWMFKIKSKMMCVIIARWSKDILSLKF